MILYDIINIKRVDTKPIITKGGDEYDHIAICSDIDIEDSSNPLQFNVKANLGIIPYVNVNGTKTKNMHLREVKDGIYNFIVGEHPFPKPYKALNILNYRNDLYRNMNWKQCKADLKARSLPGKHIQYTLNKSGYIIGVNWHEGGNENDYWDYSEGCFSSPKFYFNYLMKELKYNTVGIIFKNVSDDAFRENSVFLKLRHSYLQQM